MTALDAETARLYVTLEHYPRPDFEVCSQCEPDWSADRVAGVALHDLTLRQLAAAHVMSLDDDGLRYVAPRLLELLLRTSAPVFDFRVAELKTRIAGWSDTERVALKRWADAVWAELLTGFPVELGYFSDSPAVLDLLDWCGIPAAERLDDLLNANGVAPAVHLADLVEAVYTFRRPFETACRTTILNWIERPVIGERLQDVFFLAPRDELADRLSAAHRLWTVCAPGR